MIRFARLLDTRPEPLCQTQSSTVYTVNITVHYSVQNGNMEKVDEF